VRTPLPCASAPVIDPATLRIRNVTGQADVLDWGGVIESIGGADVIGVRCRCGIFPSPSPDMALLKTTCVHCAADCRACWSAPEKPGMTSMRWR